MNHLSSPPPLTASEAALAEVREAEAIEAKRTALDPENEARRRKAVEGLGGKMAWGEGVQDAMDKVAQRSDDGWIVLLVRALIARRTSPHVPSVEGNMSSQLIDQKRKWTRTDIRKSHPPAPLRYHSSNQRRANPPN